MPKNAEFICEKCQFKTNKKSNFDIHTLTLKHINETNETKMKQQKMPIQCECNELFNSRTTLWRHKKTCQHESIVSTNQLNTDTNVIQSPLENSPISSSPHQELINEIKELKTIVEELKGNGISSNQTINNNTQITNSICKCI